MIVPPSLPMISRAEVVQFLAQVNVPEPAEATLFARRGHFVELGANARDNDVGVYDDAIILISPTAFVSYNANTDPSVLKPKVAVLQPGSWTYEVGMHKRNDPVKRYRALVQAAEVEVFRPGTDAESVGTKSDLGKCIAPGIWRGWFGVNIHRGGFNTTGSEGCQTIYKPQWDAFLAQAEAEMKRYGQKSIRYHLTADGRN